MESIPFRNFIPARWSEKALFCFILLGLPFVFIWDFLVVTPSYFESVTWIVLIHYASVIFIMVNVIGNFYMAIKCQLIGTLKIKRTQQVKKPDWIFCQDCNVYLPPRSHHCKVCNACTLKRDHHCAYLGTCISYFNLRYFVVSVAYVWFGAIYGMIYYLPFYIDKTEFGIFTLPKILIPHFAILFGYLTPYAFLLTVFLILMFGILLMVSLLLYQQTSGIINGQTQWERKKNIESYNFGFWKNIKHALGERWYLVWIFPTIESPLPLSECGDEELKCE